MKEFLERTNRGNAEMEVDGFARALKLLSEPGSPDFRFVKGMLPPNLDDGNREKLLSAAVGKIQETMLSGHFNDLSGAWDLMSKLGAQDLAISEFMRSKLNDLLPRLEEVAIIHLGLSQPPETGIYNIDGARKVLLENGFSEEELSEEKIKEILDYRHILLALKQKRVNVLTSGKELLQACSS